MGEKYYYIDIYLNVSCDFQLDFKVDNDLYKAGNYFKTEEEATEMVEKIKKLFKGEKDRGGVSDEK